MGWFPVIVDRIPHWRTRGPGGDRGRDDVVDEGEVASPMTTSEHLERPSGEVGGEGALDEHVRALGGGVVVAVQPPAVVAEAIASVLPLGEGGVLDGEPHAVVVRVVRVGGCVRR